MSSRFKRMICLVVPHGVASMLAHLGRFYIRRANFDFGKGAIARGRFVFGICNWRRVHTTASTEFGTRHRIQFPDKIQRYIFYFGVWEPAITAFIRGSLAPGDKFVDIGANIGYYTCLAAKLVGPSGAVYAIEASPSIYETLLENIKLNKLDNVHAYNNAIFDRTETLQIFKYKETNIGKASLVRERPGAIAEEVKALPLHELIDWQILSNVRLVKIDVEGAEWSVINGMRQHLKSFGPSTEWLIEINPKAIRHHDVDMNEFIELFTAAGYSMYTIDNRYDAGWYIRHRHRYMGQPVENLVHAPPSDVKSQFDALFTKRSYGKLDRAAARTRAPEEARGRHRELAGSSNSIRTGG